MDKRRVIDYFAACDLHTVRPVDNLMDYTGGYPAAIELKDKTKGIYSYRVENEKELQYYIMRFEKYLLRPYIEGEEYEIDVFCDFDGNPIYITPKKNEGVRENEVARYRVVQDSMMILEVKSLIKELKPIGPLTISVVKDANTGCNYFIGMRPVFSMNASISIKAGADSPLALLKMMYGSKPKYVPQAADDGILFSRVETTVQIKQERNEVIQFHDFTELYEMGDDMEAVVFELEDTLYSSKDYVRSGLRAVADELPQVHNCYNRMCAMFEKGMLPINTILKEEGMDLKEHLRYYLDIYNEHVPRIALYPGIEELFHELRRKKLFLAIVTDGKPVAQRNKIKALNLESMVDEIIITDELAGNGNVHEFRKPNDIAYLIMRRRLDVPLRNMAYVGSDAKLDFEAPKKLGMVCYQYMNEDKLYDDEW
jgi:FMN phosphatase YigB (HAD superfamily)